MNSSNRTFNIAIVVSLLLHAALVGNLMHWGFARPPAPPPRLIIEMLPPVKPPQAVAEVKPPPVPPSKPIAHKTPVAKPAAPLPAVVMKTVPQLSTQMTIPAPAVAAAPPPPPGPPQHRMKAAAPGPASGGSGSNGAARSGSVYAPPEYAEKVKERVNKAIVYPADAKRFLQQCWVEYTLSVDRDGNLLDYTINNCGNDRLDAAARAALIKGGPYPPPPDTGATSYEIHGAFVFTLQ